MCSCLPPLVLTLPFRAMVNINDGAIGMSKIVNNVLFNGCRESDDHGNFNSWDRTPMLHQKHDTYGAPTWSPGFSHVSRNLIQNSYGAGHGVDHDDGSMFWQDAENVVCFSHACKGNFGSNRNCSANMVVAPGLKDAYGDSASAGAACGQETNNGHGSTFSNKYFRSNRCYYIAKDAHKSLITTMFEGCKTSGASGPAMNSTVWETSSNRYFVTSGSTVAARCGHSEVQLKEWQSSKYKQEQGSSVEPLPSVAEIVAAAEALLQ